MAIADIGKCALITHVMENEVDQEQDPNPKVIEKSVIIFRIKLSRKTFSLQISENSKKSRL